MVDVRARLRRLRDRERAVRGWVAAERARAMESRQRRPLFAPDDEGNATEPPADLLADTLPAAEPEPTRRPFGAAGRPLNRQSPFYVGFVGAIGVLAAYALWQAVASLGTVLTLLTVAIFLTLAVVARWPRSSSWRSARSCCSGSSSSHR
jgi:hypothetical protein